MKVRGLRILVLALAVTLAAVIAASDAQADVACATTITANVVVLENPTVFNRLGAQNPNWITYALRRDVVQAADLDCDGGDAGNPLCATQGLPEAAGGVLAPGQVMLRPDKRTRPMVLRSVAGACLTVHFENLLDPDANPNNAQQDALFNDDQVAGRCAGFHASGVELISNVVDGIDLGIANDGSFVGINHDGDDVAENCGPGDTKGSLVGPGAMITYNLYTPHEGAFVINSYGATLGSEASSGNLAVGMFGALNVEPVGAKIYRSQVTEEEMRLATTGLVPTNCTGAMGEVSGVDCNPGGQPIIDYEKLYPAVAPWTLEGKANLPVLNMQCNADAATAGACALGELVHSDINAIVAYPTADGRFPPSTYPLESVGNNVPTYPNRLEAFREFTSVFHDEQTNSQVFPRWYNNPVLNYTLAGVKDQFMINYGSGGIGSEIIASRLHTGPMHDCTDCAYEEFFLSSSTVGDPGGLVNFPANTNIEQCDPTNIAAPHDDPNACWRLPGLANGPVQIPDGNGGFVLADNYALFQEDPSNVHHSYQGDFAKIRNIHAGSFEQHIFHLHNNQWLHNPNDDNANYLDAQEIMPGSGHTYELANGGTGNRHKGVGDAIFHCHFYPHFAQGMWYHIRIMDVFERGTVLAVSNATDPQSPPLPSDTGFDANFHDNPFDLRSGKPAAGARALPDGELPDGWPIPAIVPIPGKPMAQMPAPVHVVAVDRGGHSLLGGRTGPDGIPDSSQAVVDYSVAFGPDVTPGTPDDVSPGYPFWLAGNECGVIGADATNCPKGITGQRMPTPPLDMLTEAGAPDAGYNPNQAGGWDGGLPRHALLGYVSGGLSLDTQNRLDFSKNIEMAQPVYFPETGTDLEKVSMAYQDVRNRPSVANNLGGGTTLGSFILNGAPPVPGGPYNDPCIDDDGDLLTAGVVGDWFDGDNDPTTHGTRGRSAFSSENPRTYKIANVQIDAVFNKVGYHYPQERIIALWEDVSPTVNKQRPPEPLVMRFNTFDCGKILHANLVPHVFELDDFQVRTPTDIIGQHIHLPKWDLTTGDGAANGWNYEDGTLSPGNVRERILAINEFNHLVALGAECIVDDADPECGVFDPAFLALSQAVLPAGTLPGQLGPIDLTDLEPVPTIDTGDTGSTVVAGQTVLTPQPHPFFGGVEGNPQTGDYLGARTTIQRILVDPVVNVAGVDRGLGITFSHDHYGPSTFQQIGLYSTILAEPAGSTWVHNESGVQIGWLPDGTQGEGRDDGGPTTWQAAILPPAEAPQGSTVGSEGIPDHREFYFEMSDFQHAYEAGQYVGADADGRPTPTAINQLDLFDATDASAPALANTWKRTVNPPLKLKSVPFPDIVTANGACPGPLGNNDPAVPRPCAEAINISHSSMWITNYRNEPVGLRVFDPDGIGPDGNNGTQTAGMAGDLAFALQSRNDRAISDLNTRFGNTPYPTAPYCQGNGGDGINCDRRNGDPFTPIMRAYERDQVKIKIQVGATEEQHQSTVHGLKWLSNGSGFGRSPNSGWRNFQSHGISEQFSLQVPVNPDPLQTGAVVDYLYANNATRDGFWSGTWGILRTYRQARQDLVVLGDNPMQGNAQVVNQNEFQGVCPTEQVGQGRNAGRQIANLVQYDVTAVLANEVLPNAIDVDGTPGPDIAISPNTQIEIGGVVVGGDSDGDGIGDNVGGPLDPAGGTLVYNRRGTEVPDVLGCAVDVEPCPEGQEIVIPGGEGPLNDPTAILYVRTEDIMFDATECAHPVFGTDTCRTAFGDPVGLQPGTPVEPLVLRANAGDCIEVTLRNALPFTPVEVFEDPDGIPDNGDEILIGIDPVPDPMPDLAGWQDLFWVVNRDLFNPVRPPEMHFFNNNLIRPSSYVGLHAQLVEYDASRDDGVLVGQNNFGQVLTAPGGLKTYRWYAGDLRHERVLGGNPNQRRFRIIATPVEFGGTNLLSADRVKQPQKGLFGALVIEPAGARILGSDPENPPWPDAVADLESVPDGQGMDDLDAIPDPIFATRLTRAQVTIDAPDGDAGSGGEYREALAIGHKIANLRWADGTAIANVNQGELGREGAEDSGHAGFNYGMEPSWFRFELPPDAPFGNAGALNSFGSITNVHAFYANGLVAGEPNAVPAIPGVSEAGDPATPVFYTGTGSPTRIHVLNGASADRDGTFILHGHVWQRDPYVCTGDSQDDEVLLPGRCDPDEPVGSQALGDNPQAKYMGGEEGMGHTYGHWPILFSGGGTDEVPGDYLFRDYAPNGNRNGQFGILRVE